MAPLYGASASPGPSPRSAAGRDGSPINDRVLFRRFHPACIHMMQPRLGQGSHQEGKHRVFRTTSLSTDRLRNLGMGNDLGFRLNGIPSCPSSLSFGPSRTAHVTRSRTSASVEERSYKQASSATRGNKEHFCDRYHIANATAALLTPRMFGGALVP